MHGNNQPIAVVPDIENHKTVNVVGVGKARAQLYIIPPTDRPHDFEPCTNLSGGLTIPLTRQLKALDRDDVHISTVLRNLRSVKDR